NVISFFKCHELRNKLTDRSFKRGNGSIPDLFGPFEGVSRIGGLERNPLSGSFMAVAHPKDISPLVYTEPFGHAENVTISLSPLARFKKTKNAFYSGIQDVGAVSSVVEHYIDTIVFCRAKCHRFIVTFAQRKP